MKSLLGDIVNKDELTLEVIAMKLTYFHEELHMLHWNTTNYARHMALGALYEYVHGFKDGVIEKLMGYIGRRPTMYKLPPISSEADEEIVVDDLLNFATHLKSFADSNGYLDIGNLADALSGEAAKTKYLFTLS